MDNRLKNAKVFLMDMDGTVYVGNDPIAGAFEALEELKRRGYQVCFLTNNSSRSTSCYVEKLAKMGYSATEDDIYSSAEATIAYLKEKQEGKKFYLVANNDVKDMFAKEGIVSTEDADMVVVCFDTELTYEKLVTACNLIQSGAGYIASHPDYVCPASPYPIPDVGSFIALIKETTGRTPDLIVGKPYAEMADRVAKKYGVKAEEMVMCGDRLYTDIKFGINAGMTSVLVMTGETTKPMLDASDVKPTIVLDTFADILKML